MVTRLCHDCGTAFILLLVEDKDEPSGEQGRVTREDKGESPRRTRASHPGGQRRVIRECKRESSGGYNRSPMLQSLCPGGAFCKFSLKSFATS